MTGTKYYHGSHVSFSVGRGIDFKLPALLGSRFSFKIPATILGAGCHIPITTPASAWGWAGLHTTRLGRDPYHPHWQLSTGLFQSMQRLLFLDITHHRRSEACFNPKGSPCHQGLPRLFRREILRFREKNFRLHGKAQHCVEVMVGAFETEAHRKHLQPLLPVLPGTSKAKNEAAAVAGKNHGPHAQEREDGTSPLLP